MNYRMFYHNVIILLLLGLFLFQGATDTINNARAQNTNPFTDHTIADRLDYVMPGKVTNIDTNKNISGVDTNLNIGNNWVTELVDNAGDVGQFTSLALDADSRPHIAYHDATNRDLKYAFHDGTNWQIETVHSAGMTGLGLSLALDATGKPHIAWTYYTPSYSLMYGYHDGSTWRIKEVQRGQWPGPEALALDSNNDPHISYFTDIDSGHFSDTLNYAWSGDGGNSWDIEVVERSINHANSRIFSSIAVDSQDRPHIAYSSGFDRHVRYAFHDGTGWQIETVLDDGQMFGLISLALDSSERPHIAHLDLTRDTLEYFWSDGTSWQRETLSSVTSSEFSLKLDSFDKAHISFADYDGTSYYLKYAYQDGDTWQIEIVPGGPGVHSSLALDAADVPHISYYKTPEGELWYASREVNSPPTANAGGPYNECNEGFACTFNGSGSSDPDPGDSITLYEWDFDYDGTSFTVDASGATLTHPSHTYADGLTPKTVALRVTDSHGAQSNIATAAVTVNNVAPEVGVITAPLDPVQVNTEIYASAAFTDVGVLDTHTAVWDWGDGSQCNTATDTKCTVTESEGSGSASGSHSYAEPGVYTVIVTVMDKDGGSDQSVFEFVVIYNPTGDFVTGAGLIDSPEGACKLDTCTNNTIGKANFGFVSKYEKGATTPSGQTHFRFKAADLDFRSTSYQWLVVAGPKAQFKGEGTINGSGNYGFMVSAIDENLTPSTDKDLFRIKIWDRDTDEVVYDNQMGAGDDAEPTTAIRGGAIVIHQGG